MSGTITYAANERVLCYHGPLIYEAKVLQVEDWDAANSRDGSEGPRYFVHYKGWKQSWDEWVPPARLLKWEEKNIQLQKSLQQQSKAANASAASSTAKAKASLKTEGGRGVRKEGTRGTKRAREEDEVSRKPEMKLQVPELLKVILVDDWEAVTKNNQLVPLPRSPNVVELLQQFREHVLAKPKSEQHLRDPSMLLTTIVSGLTTYFDRALGQNLLYRFERPQYLEQRRLYVTGPNVVVGQEKEMSSIYGGEHLLRMLVSLPQMVASSTMDAESVGILRDYVNELMQWMAVERDRLFLAEYETASVAYQNISRS
ncbi:MRG-domain-containing protein [Punctularia strigosozonata HHB-11173 SS5]|uniref:MRG-domain-containing protein n=1 Tax=Punctularia strigosozonata (strain HHB-11173) TaxID=741275 RepID=UPI0004416EE3|nr:MRG-domain-containing protein [Punctularia strigosozonata HHB-11173 SS5]EIN12865.1 MRG-domain-containing protein [Punctularia strigosozonata HHB-11173 SS5]